jgi:tetratricopeptide (TPR) repeat protein
MIPEIVAQANKLNDEGKYVEALALFDQILAQNPDNPNLLSAMATIYLRDETTLGLSISLMLRAIERSKTPKHTWLSNLGVAYKRAGLRDKAIEYFKKSIDIEANASNLVCYGGMFVENGDPTEAIKTLEKAIKLDPDIAVAHWNLALALLEAGVWERAWDEHEWGMTDGGMRVDRGSIYNKPKWDGKAEGTVVLYGEQGLGDEIMFASMLPDVLKTNKVILECHPRLKTFFEKSFGLKCYPTRKDESAPWVAGETFDYQLPLGSLGKFYRRSRQAFPGTPYMKAEPLKKGDKFRVGISWTGGKKSSRVAKRTVPLSWWESILCNQAHGVEFVSLQYTDCEKEIAELEASTPYRIRQFSEAKAQDYYEAARLTASCDLVITVCTSILHVAGSLGVPCWVMVPYHADWRCQVSGPMPWYRSVRQYRQPQEGMDGWVSVVQRVGFDLEEKICVRQQAAA